MSLKPREILLQEPKPRVVIVNTMSNERHQGIWTTEHRAMGIFQPAITASIGGIPAVYSAVAFS